MHTGDFSKKIHSHELTAKLQLRIQCKNAPHIGLKTQPLKEFGGFEEQYHSGKPATLQTWAGSKHGQTLVRLLKIRGAGFKMESRKSISLNLY